MSLWIRNQTQMIIMSPIPIPVLVRTQRGTQGERDDVDHQGMHHPEEEEEEGTSKARYQLCADTL